MSAWDLIGKAAATKRGINFAPGTKGEAILKRVHTFQSNNGDGQVLVIEAKIMKSEPQSEQYVTDIAKKEVAKTIVQTPGTEVSSVFMLQKHKAAPGAAKAALMEIAGEEDEGKWQSVRELCEVEEGAALRGMRFGFSVQQQQKKDGGTISVIRFSHVVQSDEEIDAQLKLL